MGLMTSVTAMFMAAATTIEIMWSICLKIEVTVIHPMVTDKDIDNVHVYTVCIYMSHAMRKCVFGSLRPGKTQTDLLSYRDQLES